jgi:hypothetical protein
MPARRLRQPLPGNRSAARSYYTKLVERADGGTRPELAQAKAYLQQTNE